MSCMPILGVVVQFRCRAAPYRQTIYNLVFGLSDQDPLTQRQKINLRVDYST